MIRRLEVALRWLWSMGRKFMKVVPGTTMAIVFVTLVAQIAFLLAFFLPLKVIILLGSSGIPRYFPPAWQDVDRDFLVVSLSVAAVGFYILNLLCERLIRRLTESGSRLLLARSQKLALFENQDQVAATGYRRYSGGLAGSVFAGLAFLLLLWLYPVLAWLAFGYVLVFFLGFWWGHESSEAVRGWLEANLSSVMTVAAAVGFLLGFAYLVADFLFWDPPGLIAAIISLLLVRQVFSRLAAVVLDIAGLFAQRHRLDALFFHGRALAPAAKTTGKEIWEYTKPQARDELVSSVLLQAVTAEMEIVSMSWFETGLRDVQALRVLTRSSSGDERVYLIKLFDRNRGVLARHEASLLTMSFAHDLPALPLVSVLPVGDLNCHVFEMGEAAPVTPREAKRLQWQLLGQLMAVLPPRELIDMYGRSRPLLWQRLEPGLFEHLLWACESDDARTAVTAFLRRLPEIREHVRQLPLVVVNREAGVGLLSRGEGEPLTCHWGAWGLEPVGALLPIAPQAMAVLERAYAVARERRADFQGLSWETVRFVSILSALEGAVQRQRLGEALGLLPELLTLAEKECPE